MIIIKVRRILHNSGYSVLHLHRISYGSITLSNSNNNIVNSTNNHNSNNNSNNSGTVDKLSLVVPSGSLEVCNIDQLNWASSLKYHN